MSKMDNLRAMREARYARAGAQPPRPAAARRQPPIAPPTTPPMAPIAEAEPSTADDERLCGHRAISGRTCTREHGHTAKSHRYS